MTELQKSLWSKDLESSQTFILKKADARECTNYLIISLMSLVAHLSSEKLSNTVYGMRNAKWTGFRKAKET